MSVRRVSKQRFYREGRKTFRKNVSMVQQLRRRCSSLGLRDTRTRGTNRVFLTSPLDLIMWMKKGVLGQVTSQSDVVINS